MARRKAFSGELEPIDLTEFVVFKIALSDEDRMKIAQAIEAEKATAFKETVAHSTAMTRVTVNEAGQVETKHVSLAELSRSTVNHVQIDAARKAWEAGASPRAQLDAARATTEGRLGYMPHIGLKQRAKAAKRAAARGEG